jgi:hypothetical protein
VTWSTPAINLSAAGGDAYQAQISVNAAGTAIAIWERDDGSNDRVQSAWSTNGGVTWSSPAINLSAAGGDAQDAQVSVSAAGTAVAVWSRWDGSNNIIQSASSTDGGVTWSTPAINLSAAAGDAYNSKVSVNAAGTAVAVWNRNNGSNFIGQSAWSTNGGVTWSTPAINLSAAGVDAYDPQIGVDAAGTAIAVWQRSDGSTDTIQSASSTDGGVTWSTPAIKVSVAGGDAGEPQISVNAAGTAIAVWSRFDGSKYIVQASSLTLPSLANTGATSGAATTTVGVGVGVGAGLLTAGALVIVLLRRRLASD